MPKHSERGKVRGRSLDTSGCELAPQLAVQHGVSGPDPTGLGDPTTVPQLHITLSPSNLAVLWHAVVFCLAWQGHRHKKSHLEKVTLLQSSRHWMAFPPGHPAPLAIALLGVRIVTAKYCPSFQSVPLYFQGTVIRALP